jgi:Uma2 family endonuclease
MYATKSSQHPPMSISEYLVFAESQDIRYEYAHGRVYAMSGASVRHNTITANSIAHLVNLLTGHDCTVNTSDTRIHIESKTTFRYPDITVFCGTPMYWAERTDTLTNPTLLAEVLSPSTIMTDYNEKLEEYTQIESQQAYLLISQNTPKLELFHRHDADKWLYEYVVGLDGVMTVPLRRFALALHLETIYQRIDFDEA